MRTQPMRFAALERDPRAGDLVRANGAHDRIRRVWEVGDKEFPHRTMYGQIEYHKKILIGFDDIGEYLESVGECSHLKKCKTARKTWSWIHAWRPVVIWAEQTPKARIAYWDKVNARRITVERLMKRPGWNRSWEETSRYREQVIFGCEQYWNNTAILPLI